MISFGWIAALAIFFGVARGLVSPYLRLRWRRWLTRHYLGHWLDGRGYYRIELARKVDNPDQRIAEDLRLLGFYTMTLLLGFISAVATLVSFLVISLDAVGAIVAGADRDRHHHPRLYGLGRAHLCLLRHLLANLVGRRLIPLNFMQQRYEANFRFGLIRVRENAEGIALYRGEPRESEVLDARFTDVFNNTWRVLVTELQLVFYQIGYGQLAIIFPYIVTAPKFFAGAITLGVVMQTRAGLRPGAVGAVVLHRQLHQRRRAEGRDGASARSAGRHRRQATRGHCRGAASGSADVATGPASTSRCPTARSCCRT